MKRLLKPPKERNEAMATVKLSDIEGMTDTEYISKAERLALEFLEVFEPDRPLDQEEFEEWIEINTLSGAEVREAANEAVGKGWVEDTTDGLRLTDAGRQKTQE
jgi:coproporphyrinogen III oxidase-like Fe-S oxidoreductase